MAPRRNPSKGAGSSPSQGARKETKHGGNKNGKKEGLSGSSFFTWFMVIALLGVWTSVAVVWFELVDYEEVLAKAKDFRYNLSEVLQGKLGLYDADGDGDFDVEDAKVLLGEEPGGVDKRKAKAKGLKERSVPAQPTPAESEESIQAAEQSFVTSEHKNVEAELEEEIQAILHEALHSQAGERHEEGADEGLNDEHEEGADEGLNDERQEKDEVYEEAFEIPNPYEYYMDLEEPAYESKVPDNTELAQEDALEHHGEPNYGEGTETQDTAYAELETGKTEETAGKEPVNEYYYEESIQEPADDAEKEDENEIPEDVEINKKQSEEKEHTEDTVAAGPQETEVPVEAENYSNDDLVDT
uniref:Aspartyl beta-hydroxylase/Triadin domain-containing protein n=1 Tax=Terrapene triunguis TaxID=2587831 RepID=A0A674KAS9_9SAUR